LKEVFTMKSLCHLEEKHFARGSKVFSSSPLTLTSPLWRRGEKEGTFGQDYGKPPGLAGAEAGLSGNHIVAA
jgi:hypothetical protein